MCHKLKFNQTVGLSTAVNIHPVPPCGTGNTGANALNENEPLSYYCESVILAMHLKISHIDTSIYTTPTFLF